MDRIDVVSAIIIRDGKVLLQQRSAQRDFPGKWETPGGKVKTFEPTNDALQREIFEELGVLAYIGNFLGMAEFGPPVVSAPLRIRFYRVDIYDQTPRCLDAMGLGWFSREAVIALDMTPGTAAMRAQIAALCSAHGHQDQPAPVGNDHPALWPMVIAKLTADPPTDELAELHKIVIADMQKRHQDGMAKYKGQALQPFNGHDALRDVYEELLDGRVYAEQVEFEKLADTHFLRSALTCLIFHVRKAMLRRERGGTEAIKGETK